MTRLRHLSHAIGVDDAPFAREYRGDVLTVGAVFADRRLEGVLSTRVRRDATRGAPGRVQRVFLRMVRRLTGGQA